MNNDDFAHLVSLKAGLTNEEAQEFLEAFAGVVSDELKSKAQIDIDGLGTFNLLNNNVEFNPDKNLLSAIK